MENFGSELYSCSKNNRNIDAKAIKRATKTVRNIRGVEVIHQKGVVREGEIVEYRVVLKLSFGVE